jgi:hypothetical protein
MSQNTIYETPPEGPLSSLQQPSLDPEMNVNPLDQELNIESVNSRPTGNNIELVDTPDKHGYKKQKPKLFNDRKRGDKANELLDDAHWAKPDLKLYENENQHVTSGREYNGSDKIFKDVENQKFTDNNDGNFTEIKVAYIYIISKYISGETYYKVGLGGTGLGSRLGGAQTFLIPGLGDSTGFKVHYLFFFHDKYKNHYLYPPAAGGDTLAKKIEGNIHKNLRYYLTAANITFKNNYPSEWYLIPSNNIDVKFFIGFIFDIIASHEKQPHSIWRLDDRGVDKTIQLPISRVWKRRMAKHPYFQESVFPRADKEALPLGVDIKISFNKKEDRGTVDTYKNAFLGESGENIYEFKFNNKDYQIIQILKYEELELQNDNTNPNNIYAEISVLGTNENEIENEIPFLEQQFGLQNISFLKKQNSNNFYIKIGDLLELIKKDKFDNQVAYENWNLKNNHMYYENESKGENVVFIEEKFNEIAPLWYYLNSIQNEWVDIIRKTPSLNIHEDYDEENVKNKYIIGDDFKKVVNDDLTKIMVKRNKVRGQDNVIVDDSEDEIELLYVFILMDLNDKLQRLNQIKKTNVLINGQDMRLNKKDAPHLLKLEETYFIHYNQYMIPDMKSKYEGKFVYYEMIEFFTFTIDKSNKPWVKIKEYYKEEENKKTGKIWNIPLESINFESHKKHFTFLKKGSEEYKNIVKLKSQQDKNMRQIEDKVVYIDVDNEVEYARNVVPKYIVGDVIKIIPDNYEDFGIPDFERKSYHYAEIVGINRDKGQYRIRYYPPYDKVKLWKRNNKKRNDDKDYVENHNIEAIEGAIPTLLDLDDPEHEKELRNYKNKLKNVFKIEAIVDHKPPRKGAKKNKKVKNHEAFLSEKNPKYLVKYKDLHESFNEYKDATYVYETAEAKVKAYWRKLYPGTTRRQGLRQSTINQRRTSGGASKGASKGGRRKTLKKKNKTKTKYNGKKKTKKNYKKKSNKRKHLKTRKYK